MTSKKSRKANLERNRSLFFEIGLLLTLGIVLLAFEWGTKPEEYQENIITGNDEHTQEVIPVTIQKERKDVTPPPPVPPEEIEVVPDDIKIENEIKLASSETEMDDEINYERLMNNEEKDVEEQTPYYNPSQMPTFKGKNINEFRKYVMRNLYYPNEAKENGVEGTVTVKFVVNTDGSLSDFEIIRTPDPQLTEVVLDIIKNSKGWEPGKQGTRKVRVYVSIPVTFRLN